MKFTRRAATVGGLGLLAESSLSTSSLADFGGEFLRHRRRTRRFLAGHGRLHLWLSTCDHGDDTPGRHERGATRRHKGADGSVYQSSPIPNP